MSAASEWAEVLDMARRLDKQRESIKTLQAERDQLRLDLEASSAERNRFRHALEVYADKAMWCAIAGLNKDAPQRVFARARDIDGYVIARRALSRAIAIRLEDERKGEA